MAMAPDDVVRIQLARVETQLSTANEHITDLECRWSEATTELEAATAAGAELQSSLTKAKAEVAEREEHIQHLEDKLVEEEAESQHHAVEAARAKQLLEQSRAGEKIALDHAAALKKQYEGSVVDLRNMRASHVGLKRIADDREKRLKALAEHLRLQEQAFDDAKALAKQNELAAKELAKLRDENKGSFNLDPKAYRKANPATQRNLQDELADVRSSSDSRSTSRGTSSSQAMSESQSDTEMQTPGQQPPPQVLEPARPVEKIVDRPVEVEKRVEVYIDRPVEVEKRVEIYVDRPVEVEKRVEVIVDRPVEVEKRVEVIVDRPIEVEKRVEVYIDRPVEIEKRVEVIVDRPIEVEKRVEVEKIIRVKNNIFVDRPFQISAHNPIKCWLQVEFNCLILLCSFIATSVTISNLMGLSRKVVGAVKQTIDLAFYRAHATHLDLATQTAKAKIPSVQVTPAMQPAADSQGPAAISAPGQLAPSTPDLSMPGRFPSSSIHEPDTYNDEDLSTDDVPAPVDLKPGSLNFWPLNIFTHPKTMPGIKRTLLGMAFHLLVYLALYIGYSTYHERQIWLAANDSTRVLVHSFASNPGDFQSGVTKILFMLPADWKHAIDALMFEHIILRFNIPINFVMPG
jgi:hypothetical protein